MADRKISDLTALTTPASGDYLPIVDISEAAAASKNKRITIEELFRGVPLGTAAAPSIAIEGDENTGIYSPGADQLAISTNGQGRLFVDSSGNVGIGTSLTTAYFINYTPLKLSGSAGGSLGIERAGELRLLLAADNSLSYVSSLGNGGIVFSAQAGAFSGSTGTERLRITSDGKLGLGASAPDSKLVIQQNSSDTNPLDQNTPSTSSGLSIKNYNFGVGTYTALSLETADSTSVQSASIIAQSVSGGTSPNVLFTQRTAANVNTTRMVIDSSGNVGIGNTGPSTELDVSGSINLTGNQTFSTTTTPMIAATAAGSVLRFGTGSGGAERARIDSSGRLLVGTSTSEGKFYNTTGTNHLIQAQSSSQLLQSLVCNAGTIAPHGAHITLARSRGTAPGNYTVVASGDNLGVISFQGTDGTEFVEAARIFCDIDGTPGADDMPGRLVFSTTKDGASSPTSKLTINNAGLFKIHQQSSQATNTYSSEGGYVKHYETNDIGTAQRTLDIASLGDGTYGSNIRFLTNANSSATATERMRITDVGQVFALSTDGTFTSATTVAAGTSTIVFRGRHSATAGNPVSGTDSFRVWSNGDVVNTNDSYGAISDIKLKENIVDAESQWDDFKAVRFRKYNFKEETGHETFTQLGVIAQELELVSPGLVTETPDLDEDGNDLGTVTKSVKYSILTKKALVALQEAMERIEVLEQRLTDAGIA